MNGSGVCRCGSPLPAMRYRGNPRLWCSEACRVWHHNHPGQQRSTAPRPCLVCSRDVARRSSAVYCSDECRRAADRHHNGARRALRNGGDVGEPVYLPRLIERDGTVCSICDHAMDVSLAFPDPMSISIDHVVAISEGGAHDPGNAALAHLHCNQAKARGEMTTEAV